ncbi:MAG TPA: bacillithiol transferase BstA [Acidobacteriaceae bacterium]|nr:bacillithiol transferase BstA [Acidobacteriaceae bacterium]
MLSLLVMANTAADPRYPIGPGPRLESIDVANIPHYIASLAALPENLRSAVYGMSDAQLDTPYREGGWTVRQVVHHVADSHMNAYIRTRLALTEDWPVVKSYDEKQWAMLDDSKLPVAVSLELLDPLHRRWVALFRSLSAAEWERGYQHEERGRTTVLQTLALYEWHARHHVAHITELRKSKGWE